MRSRRPSSSRRVWRQALACRTTVAASSRRRSTASGPACRWQRATAASARASGSPVASASAAASATSPARCSGDAEAATTIESRASSRAAVPSSTSGERPAQQRAGRLVRDDLHPGTRRCGRARPGQVRRSPVGQVGGRLVPGPRGGVAARRGVGLGPPQQHFDAVDGVRGEVEGLAVVPRRRSRRPAGPSPRRPPPRRIAPRPRRSPAARSGRGGGRARRARWPGSRTAAIRACAAARPAAPSWSYTAARNNGWRNANRPGPRSSAIAAATASSSRPSVVATSWSAAAASVATVEVGADRGRQAEHLPTARGQAAPPVRRSSP